MKNITFDSFNTIFDFNINIKNYYDQFCGIIGFKTDKYNIKCNIKNNIINNLYSKGYIKENEWILKYTSEESGLLIFGSDNINELIPNFNSYNLHKTNAFIKESDYNWAFDILKIICVNNTNENKNFTYAINKEITKAEIDNDFSLIQGSYDYYNFIEKNYFKKYIEKKICSKNIWYKNKFTQYFVFECIKKDFDEKELFNL